MIKAKNKYQRIDHQSSYFYQRQNKIKRTRRVKVWLLFLLPLMLLCSVSIVLANELALTKATSDNGFIAAPQLLFNHPNPMLRKALPVDISADIKVSGLIAYSEIKQVFFNPHDITLEGIYQFPLPSNAAVNYMEIKVGDRVIEGVIKEKQAAKKIYQQAKRQGKKASLVEQQRANLFTNKVANIPAHSKVVVTLRLVTPVNFYNGKFSLALPLAVTERYHPNEYAVSPAETDTTIMPVVGNASANGKANVKVVLNAGLSVTGIQSQSHGIIIKTLNSEQTKFQITLDNQQVVADRQFVLNWQLPEYNMPSVASFTEQIADEYFTLLTFFPSVQSSPANNNDIMARDVVFVIDTSGSMQGNSLVQAKASLRHALTLLTAKDSFNVIEFNSNYTSLFHQNQMVTPDTLVLANEFVDRLQANGGTEMYQPLAQALMMKHNSEQSHTALSQVVFITDGAVGNEFELMGLIETNTNQKRIFTVGIGRAPNGYFMKKAAQFGRGSYVFIHNSHDVLAKMSELMEKISRPAVTNIELMFDQQVHSGLEVFPNKIPDLYLGEPLQVAIKSQLPINSVQVIGQMKNKPWYQQLLVENNDQSEGVSTLWARRKIEDLLDGLVTGEPVEQVKKQVVATSIAHQIISPYTSFIAVEKQPETQMLIAKNQTARLAEAMSVALPKTALGWKIQLIIGLSLLFAFYVLAGKRYARLS